MANHDATRALTYDELADARGITKKAAQTLARRRRWERRKGNDGRVRVMVPTDELRDHQKAPQTVHQKGLQADHQTDHQKAPQALPEGPTMDELRAELADARVALARAETSLAAEQRRTSDLSTDRDRFATLASQLTDALEAMERARQRGLLARLFGRAA